MFGLVRNALFVASPEAAHELALESLRLGHNLGATSVLCHTPKLPVRAMGLEFINPVGLAAGMDKNGDYIDALGSLGFGFIEIGTITPRPQPGNPVPRVFRLPKAAAMINRLGFNNKGVDHLVARAGRRRWPGVLGINIGKNFDTPNERAADDYVHCLEKVYPVANYVTVNISSPNTLGLRDLQSRSALDALLAALATARHRLADQHGYRLPIAVKVSPDLEPQEIPGIAEILLAHDMDGLIATNTTLSRPGVSDLPHAGESGGLSGHPLLERANDALIRFRSILPADFTVIGVGGINSGDDAAGKIALGADLVQFYTGFVYQGPGLISASVKAIAQSLEAP